MSGNSGAQAIDAQAGQLAGGVAGLLGGFVDRARTAGTQVAGTMEAGLEVGRGPLSPVPSLTPALSTLATASQPAAGGCGAVALPRGMAYALKVPQCACTCPAGVWALGHPAAGGRARRGAPPGSAGRAMATLLGGGRSRSARCAGGGEQPGGLLCALRRPPGRRGARACADCNHMPSSGTKYPPLLHVSLRARNRRP